MFSNFTYQQMHSNKWKYNIITGFTYRSFDLIANFSLFVYISRILFLTYSYNTILIEIIDKIDKISK